MRILLTALSALTLASGSTHALAAPPEPAPDHVLKVEATGDKGAEKLSVSVLPLGPWKWNHEYPARLEFEMKKEKRYQSGPTTALLRAGGQRWADSRCAAASATSATTLASSYSPDQA